MRDASINEGKKALLCKKFQRNSHGVFLRVTPQFRPLELIWREEVRSKGERLGGLNKNNWESILTFAFTTTLLTLQPTKKHKCKALEHIIFRVSLQKFKSILLAKLNPVTSLPCLLQPSVAMRFEEKLLRMSEESVFQYFGIFWFNLCRLFYEQKWTNYNSYDWFSNEYYSLTLWSIATTRFKITRSTNSDEANLTKEIKKTLEDEDGDLIPLRKNVIDEDCDIITIGTVAR